MAGQFHFPAAVNFTVLAVLFLTGPSLAAADQPALAPISRPSAEKVNKALSNARHYLIRQLGDKTGRPVLDYDEDSHRHGIETALVLRALSLAGEKYDESATLRRGYAWLIARPREGTELVALRIAALAEASSLDQSLYRCLADDVAWLIEAGSEEGNYSTESLKGQSQLAYNNPAMDLVTDALDLASKQDVLVPREFWERNARAWIRSQLTAGGWKVMDGWSAWRANFTMTAAGICGLATSLAHFDERTDEELVRRTKDALKLAKKWLDEQFSLPPRRGSRDYCFDDHHFPGPNIDAFDSCELQNRWLVNLGRLRTRGHIGRIGRGEDPWSRLAAELVEFQNDDGSWGGGAWSSGVFQIQLTASGVVFLSALEEERRAVQTPRVRR